MLAQWIFVCFVRACMGNPCSTYKYTQYIYISNRGVMWSLHHPPPSLSPVPIIPNDDTNPPVPPRPIQPSLVYIQILIYPHVCFRRGLNGKKYSRHALPAWTNETNGTSVRPTTVLRHWTRWRWSFLSPSFFSMQFRVLYGCYVWRFLGRPSHAHSTA